MRFKEFIKNNVPPSAAIMLILAFISAIIKIAAVISTPFAEFFNRYVSSVFRAVFAHITSLFPFSVAETLILCMIPVAVIFFIYSVKVSANNNTLTKQIFRVVMVICFIFSTFVLNYSTGYNTRPLDERMGLEVSTPTEDELYSACAMAAVELYDLEESIYVSESGSTKMPYSFSEMTDKLNEAYDALYEKYDFISPLHTGVKQIALSRPLTYTHMSGFYTFFTGEANVNMNYPDYVIVYTTAHEMAHQRGIAREDEANYIAFLACIESADEYIRYCGYANILEYLSSALAKVNYERYSSQVYDFFPKITKNELAAYARAFEPYSDNIAADISSAANDTYLKSQGVSEGEESYGLVVDLASAYFNGILNGTIKKK